MLTRTEVNYSTTTREALAVVQAVKWFRSYLLGIPFILRTDHASLQWLFRQNADGMTYRMIEVLQEFDFQEVHRPGEKHGNADALSRQTTREPEWQEGEEEAFTGSCPEPTNLETAIAKLREPEVFLLSITQQSEENVTSVELKASSDEVRAKQREDLAIATILQKATVPLNDRQYNGSTFGVNPMTRKQAQKLEPEVLGLWNNWEQFMMKDGMIIRKWYAPGKDGYQELIVVPQVAKRSVQEQLHDSKVTGEHFALHKTPDRTRQRFWWPMMRRDIDNWIKSCKPCAARSTAGRNLKAELQPITVGVRFAKVAADILGPVTRN